MTFYQINKRIIFNCYGCKFAIVCGACGYGSAQLIAPTARSFFVYINSISSEYGLSDRSKSREVNTRFDVSDSHPDFTASQATFSTIVAGETFQTGWQVPTGYSQCHVKFYSGIVLR